MSNILFIHATEFKTLNQLDGSSSFGFIASDNYGCYFDCNYPSEDAFFAQFPTEDSLIRYVLGLNQFGECAEVNDDGSYRLAMCSGIQVFGY